MVAQLCTELHVNGILCRYIHHVISLHSGIVYLSFKTTVNDIELSDSRRVDCVLCRCNHHMILLQASIVSGSSKTTVDDIEWSNSRWVKYCLTNEPISVDSSS